VSAPTRLLAQQRLAKARRILEGGEAGGRLALGLSSPAQGSKGGKCTEYSSYEEVAHAPALPLVAHATILRFFAQRSGFHEISTRIFYPDPEPLLEQGGLVAEDDTGEMNVLPRRRHRAVPCDAHDRHRETPAAARFVKAP
jgi:hypothetical protein